MMNRIKILPLSKRFLSDVIGNVHAIILKDGGIMTFNGIPKDATVVDMYYDIVRQSWLIALKSRAFKEVPEGGIAPNLEVLVRTANERFGPGV